MERSRRKKLLQKPLIFYTFDRFQKCQDRLTFQRMDRLALNPGKFRAIRRIVLHHPQLHSPLQRLVEYAMHILDSFRRQPTLNKTIIEILDLQGIERKK